MGALPFITFPMFFQFGHKVIWNFVKFFAGNIVLGIPSKWKVKIFWYSCPQQKPHIKAFDDDILNFICAHKLFFNILFLNSARYSMVSSPDGCVGSLISFNILECYSPNSRLQTSLCRSYNCAEISANSCSFLTTGGKLELRVCVLWDIIHLWFPFVFFF